LGGLPACGSGFASFSGLYPCILHAGRPVYLSGIIPQYNQCVSRNQIAVVHFVTGGAQDHQILLGIILAIMIEMGHLQNALYTESAISTYRGICIKGNLAIVNRHDILIHSFQSMSALFIFLSYISHASSDWGISSCCIILTTLILFPPL